MLINTIKECNRVCNYISDLAWNNKEFKQFALHRLCYKQIKEKYNIPSQMIIRCIAKVSNAYKLDTKKKRTFNLYGGIAYDSRILSYKNESVSISTVNKRQKIQFVCHNEFYLKYTFGESVLIFRRNKFFLFQTIDIPQQPIEKPQGYIGLDFGIKDIVCTSDGESFSSKWLSEYKERRLKIRKSIQSKVSKGSRKLLKRISRKESATIAKHNHTISKVIVLNAKEKNLGIVIENLRNIRKTTPFKGKSFNKIVNEWSFSQLRDFITYKCSLHGVDLTVVNPSYTSQTCSVCHHLGLRKGKLFKCDYCGSDMDADVNAARNIAQFGAAINQPEKSEIFSCELY